VCWGFGGWENVGRDGECEDWWTGRRRERGGVGAVGDEDSELRSLRH
jgi:hypothetical protein